MGQSYWTQKRESNLITLRVKNLTPAAVKEVNRITNSKLPKNKKKGNFKGYLLFTKNY